MYDHAITGIDDNGAQVAIPFLSGSNVDYPYLRESEPGQREQFDTSPEPGEQTLTGWWNRSQASFDLGYGVEFTDTAKDKNLGRRFEDSCGVNTFDPGMVYLLRKTTKVNSGSNRNCLATYSLDTEEGVLHAYNDGSNYAKLYKVTSAGSVSSAIDFGHATTPLFDLVTDGGYYYILTNAGIYRGPLDTNYADMDGDKVIDHIVGSNIGNVTQGRIKRIKDRLVVALNMYANSTGDSTFGAIFTLTDSQLNPSAPEQIGLSTSTGHDISPDGEITIPGWQFSGIAEGPQAIFVSGYAGDLSRIYSLGLDESSGSLEVGNPIVRAELPRGEVIRSMTDYMGTYLIVGTNLGVRIALIDGNEVRLGPLSVKSDRGVYAVSAYGEYAYAGGSKHRERAAGSGGAYTDRPGLYKLHLAEMIRDENGETGQYPAARDLYGPVTYSSVKPVTDITPIGQTGRMAFVIEDEGLFMEHGTDVVSTGWIRTGKIRMDTWEEKIFQFIRVTNSVTAGSIQLFWSTETDAETYSQEWDNATYRMIDTEATDGDPHLFAQFMFLLKPSGTTATPVLTGYQVRTTPANVVQRNIRVSLLCFPREKTREGSWVERSTWDRIRQLEAAEKKGAFVRYQNLNTGEESYALIDKIQFVASHIPEGRQDQEDPGGILMVTLRLIS